MNYTSIHIYGHLLSDDILHEIETDSTMQGNREHDYNLDVSLTAKIDNAWSSLRNDWKLFSERNLIKDTYGTNSVRRLMNRFFSSLDYELDKQESFLEVGENRYDITYLCSQLSNLPIIVVGDKTGDSVIDSDDKCTLDIRQKGDRKQKSPHATMLDYLNNSDQVYGIVTNGQILRIIRNTGQLVKLTYIEFDIRKIVEEDHYSEFCLLFRILHSSRFCQNGDDACILEQWFNRSVESGNRIRAGLSKAVQTTMEILGKAVLCGNGSGNEALRNDIVSGIANSQILNKELIHFIYRILFLFIIEDRDLVYDIKESDKDYEKKVHSLEIYKKYYAISRFRHLSEYSHLKDEKYSDLWEGLFESFRLFEDEKFGSPLCINPLGGVLFAESTLKYLRKCKVDNRTFLEAFSCLNEFRDEKQNRVKINYSSLDVEEFGSVYEGILEMRAVVTQGTDLTPWNFSFGSGLDRKSTSSYYTRPDLVQSLIRTTLEPVIKEKLAKMSDASSEDKVKELLSMKLCDAASGSGHIVLAMARTLAWYVCAIRTGEDNPASSDYRQALREVIQKCIYAVDYNPDAVELCKVVLWIEGYCAGKPLSFLDHHIRCGNSVVGVANLDVLLEGVPQDAFTAENKDVLKNVKARNKKALDEFSMIKESLLSGKEKTLHDSDFSVQNIDNEQIDLSKKVNEINAMPEDSLIEQITKQKKWEDLMVSPRIECLRRACDIYTYAFYREIKVSDVDWKYQDDTFNKPFQIPYTRTVFQALYEIKHLDSNENNEYLTDAFKQEVESAAKSKRFFHWCVEFPEVFANGGFDVMCGNPPWDKIKVEDKKWFESQGRLDIVNAGTAAQREKAIEALLNSDPQLWIAYQEAIANAEAMSRFVRFSGRFDLTATGDIDFYPMFAELCLNFSRDAWGLVIPTGICFNASTQKFFAKLVDENRLISLYGFENEEKLFAAVAHNYKFCLITAGTSTENARIVQGGFYLRRVDHLLDSSRIYNIQTKDFVNLNPNTRTCPVFRTSYDAQLTAKIYKNSKIIVDEQTGHNPWKIQLGSHFHMSNDSNLFKTYYQLTCAGAEFKGNVFELEKEVYMPLYEGKMIYLYNHHYATWPINGDRPTAIPSPTIQELEDVNSHVLPWYWIPKSAVIGKKLKRNNNGDIIWEWSHPYFIAYRGIMESHDIRSFILSLIPDNFGLGNSATLIYSDLGTLASTSLLGMMSSLVLDYSARQKLGGKNMSTFIVKQLPILTYNQIKTSGFEKDIVERVTRLCWFNHDLDGWMEELREECSLHRELNINLPLAPVVWDELKRSVWQAELDAIFAHLYGLNTEDLRYILDPEDVCGVGCINETFRVLKDREIRELGEYRTKRLVMEAWNKFGFDK